MKKYSFSMRFIISLEAFKYFILSAVIFRVALEIVYIEFVSPVFNYSGFVVDVVGLKYIESWIIFLFLVSLFPRRLNKPSDYLMSFMLFSYLTPLIVLYGLSNASREHFYLILLAVILVMIFRKGRPLKLPIIKFGRYLAFAILGFGVLAVTAWLIKSGGLRFFNLNLLLVYEFREDVREVISIGVMGYLNTWTYKVFGPLLLAIALWKRRYLLAATVILLHIFWFGISSHKSVLFFPFLIIFLWMWFRNTKALAIIPIALTSVVVFSFSVFLVFDNIVPSSLFVRRVFFVPPFLTFTYYDFFSDNQFVYWSNSKLANFIPYAIDYPYNVSTGRVIGEYLGSGSNANNSFFATGYMHAGIMGVILYGVFVGYLFRILDSVSYNGIPVWIAVACVIIPIQSLISNADLTTSLLTHGIGVSIILLFLLRTSSDVSGNKLIKLPSNSGAIPK